MAGGAGQSWGEIIIAEHERRKNGNTGPYQRGRCFKCKKKLESTEEKRYGFCKECLATMGVDLELS